MARVAGFADIGKSAGDLLGKGFDFKNTFTLNSATSDGTKMTVKSVKDGEKLSGEIKLARSMFGAAVDINISSSSQVSVTAAKADLYPGLKATLAANIPDHTSGKLTLDYCCPHLTTKSVVGLTSSPIVQISAATGTPNAIVGVDGSYDTAKSALTKWSAGAAYLSKDYSASIMLADQGSTLKASYSHAIDSTQTAACEVVRKLNSDSTTFTMGYEKKLDTGATLKMRLANSGLGAMTYSFSPAVKTVMSISGQFDTTNLDKNSKIGMSLDVKA